MDISKMKTIPSGVFQMGSDYFLMDEQPTHTVFVEEFEMAEFPVTRGEYEKFLKASGFPPPSGWEDLRFMDPRQPVVCVTWDEAVAYCAWISELTDRHFSLPTEAEREKACRGGLEGQVYPWGDHLPKNRPVKSTWDKKPDRVGLYPPNSYGLFDMEGNVHEWCLDWYHPDYYAHSPQENPQGPESGERRSSRGGAWRHSINVSRCSARSCLIPTFRYNDYGFRMVCRKK